MNTFTESVDWLLRAGHDCVTVELHAADDAGIAALRALTADLRVRHCELVVLWEEKENML